MFFKNSGFHLSARTKEVSRASIHFGRKRAGRNPLGVKIRRPAQKLKAGSVTQSAGPNLSAGGERNSFVVTPTAVRTAQVHNASSNQRSLFSATLPAASKLSTHPQSVMITKPEHRRSALAQFPQAQIQ